jgi:predicted Rossmann fold flavoprotein
MMAWLSDHGVETKIEDDGRVFPASNTSASIIDCFLGLCEKYKIEIITRSGVEKIESISNKWSIKTSSARYTCNQILVATGSSPATWKILKQLGHHIIDPVPSLFTFNIKHPLIDGLAGISVPTAEIVIKGEKIQETGALLITHWGLSGPAILKLSSWGARHLFDKKYQFEIEVNWVGMDVEDVSEKLIELRKNSGNRKVLNTPLFGLPKRLWQRLISIPGLSASNFADLNAGQIESLINQITKCTFKVSGKSTFKDEFVTCGGIDTSEINFKTMESKISPGLYFAGEVINIDAVTGGFNFQAAWTEAYIAARTIAKTPGNPKDH